MAGRPGGNPDFGTKYARKTNRAEPLVKKLTIRIPESMEFQLKQIDEYQEFVREAIAEKLRQLEQQAN